MPAKSKKQQRLMGMAYAYSKGELKDAPESVKRVAKSFLKNKKKGKDSLRHFAKTSHTNIPEKIKESHILRFKEFNA